MLIAIFSKVKFDIALSIVYVIKLQNRVYLLIHYNKRFNFDDLHDTTIKYKLYYLVICRILQIHRVEYIRRSITSSNSVC